MDDRYQNDPASGTATTSTGGFSQTGSGVGGVRPSDTSSNVGGAGATGGALSDSVNHATTIGGTSPEYRDGATADDVRPAATAYDDGRNDNDAGIGETDETRSLISADKVQGTAVYDTSGEKLGSIDSLMIDKREGHVEYAVMASGGFLGIGERYQPLPWDALSYDTDLGGYRVNQSIDTMRTAPNYSRDEVDSYDYDGRGREIDDWYGTEATQSSTMPSSGIGSTDRSRI